MASLQRSGDRARRVTRAARAVPLLVGLALLLAACGGDSESGSPTEATTTVPGDSLVARLSRQSGEDVEIAFGASDFAVGTNRLPVAVIRGNGKLVQAPRARIFIARSAAASPEIETTAKLVPLGPHSHPGRTQPHDHVDVTDLYVADVELRKPGRYSILVEPEGESVQAAGEFVVRRRSESPQIGSRAIASDTPTLADAPASQITTARPPDIELLQTSVKQALAQRAPFVVAFATPKFCQTRTCGPTVEVVESVRRRFASNGIRFIHVEVYKDNEPSRGVNRWMREWKLPSEPWVFVVDKRGIIRAKFEGSVSEAELEAAVRRHLA